MGAEARAMPRGDCRACGTADPEMAADVSWELMGTKTEKPSAARGVASGSSNVDVILDVVAGLLGSDGYDGLQVRDVASLARVSLTTVYKYFPSRDELIVATVERWMDRNVYASLEDPPRAMSLHDAFSSLMRHVLEPWEEQPWMVEAFVRAQMTPPGDRLYLQGVRAAEPFMREAVRGHDPGYVDDVSTIVTNVVYGLLVRTVFGPDSGRVEVAEIFPAVERTLYRLTECHEAARLPSGMP